MKNFIDQIRSSIYNPDFYKKLEDKPASFTVYYLLKLSISVALIGTIIISILFTIFQGNTFAKAGVKDVKEFALAYINKNYQDDLIINFENGILTTNSSSTISFPFPVGLEDESEKKFQNFLALDTNENLNRNSFEKYDSYMVLSTTSGAVYDPQKGTVKFFNYKDESMDEFSDFVLTKADTLDKVSYYSNYLSSILPVIYILITLFLFLSIFLWTFMGTIIFAVFTAFLAWILGKIWQKDLEYSVWYQKAIHADTLYIVLVWTLGWLFPLGYIPFLNTILVLVILFVNNIPKSQ